MKGERPSTCTEVRLVQIKIDAVKTIRPTDTLDSNWASFRYKVKEALSKEAAF